MTKKSLTFILLFATLLFTFGCGDKVENKKNKEVSLILEKEYDFEGIIVTEVNDDKGVQVLVQFENFPIKTWRMDKLNDFARDVAATTDESLAQMADDNYFILIEFLKTKTDHRAVRNVYSAYKYRFYTDILRKKNEET